MNKALKQAKHFTLTEMLTVIMIIAILATIGFAVITRVQGDAMRTATLAQINNLYVAMESFKMDQGYYPGSVDFDSSSDEQYYIGIESSSSSYNCILEDGSTLRKYYTFGENDTEEKTISSNDFTFLVDAWGEPLRYMTQESEYEDVHNTGKEPQDDLKNKSKFLADEYFLIYSVGEDGEEEGEDPDDSTIKGCRYDHDTLADDDINNHVDDVFVSDI